MVRPVLLLLAIVGGCSSETPSSSTQVGNDAGFSPVTDAGACGVTTARISPAPANHVAQSSPLTFASNPPCGGDHYPFWGTWGNHQTPLPRGNWIHNLEHGGVVFLYRCANRAECPEIASRLEALAASLPPDPKCAGESPPVRNRTIVTPDPDLPAGVQVAAAAWGFNLVARCVDDAALRDFYLAHTGRTHEDFCDNGVAIAPRDGGSDADGG